MKMNIYCNRKYYMLAYEMLYCESEKKEINGCKRATKRLAKMH